MKIILLSGKPNTGKTTTLNALYKKITNDGKENIVVKRTVVGNPASKDFECVVEYNNKKVAIFSMGDYYGAFIEVLIKYANRDILVLAYNETFAKKLDEMIGKLNYHCVIRKSVSKSNADAVECEKENEKDRDLIIKELEH